MIFEKLAIPGAGAIIIAEPNGAERVLMQERHKDDAPSEKGLIEIPAGKIRAFESVYDTLRREIKEETGLEVIEIEGESTASVFAANNYKVLNYTPFSCSQNLEGDYPILVLVFICRVRGELLDCSDEARNYRWATKEDIAKLLDTPDRLYPMHVDTLRKYIYR